MKADRLAKVVAQKSYIDELIQGVVARVLKRERAQVRRIVKEHEKRVRIRYALPGGIKYYAGVQVCIEILLALNRRTP